MAPSKQRPRQPWKGSASYPYETDYNDHFETPVVAYEDVAVFLDWVNSTKTDSPHCSNNNRSDLILYDPYYCQGRTARLFQELGFTNIIHEKRDFYHDIKTNQVPIHDVIITNPPYSDQHKKQCLDFCWDQLQKHDRPFCLLLPAYVAARQYYRQLVQDNGNDKDHEDSTLQKNKVIYLIPNQHYQYDHPEGTGKAESPFDSLWFCGLPCELSVRARLQEFLDVAVKAGKFRVAQSLSELEDLKLISTQTRPNPKQRRKKRKAALGGDIMAPRDEPTTAKKSKSRPAVTTTTTTSPPTVVAPKNTNKKSKHRDASGGRTRKRF
jgi:hypothetical protein